MIFIISEGCTNKKWTMKFTEEIDLASEVKEMAWVLFFRMYYGGSLDQFAPVLFSFRLRIFYRLS